MSAEVLSHPNLFSYATSELSQDAFICWLAAWADLKYKDIDPPLHNVARVFVGSMISKVDSKSGYDIADIITVGIGRQVGKLDVLIEVNKGLLNQLAILVEDKTHTNNHSDQLNRYYEQIKAKGYSGFEIIPIYFKTGYQSRFDTLGAFKPYLRSDFLSVLRSGQETGVSNAIFSDFLAHLEQIEWAVSQFSQKPLDDWRDNDWRGFYMALYDFSENYRGNWGHVSNPSGGFLGFWWYGIENNTMSYDPYLQLETSYFDPQNPQALRHKLSFKISIRDKSLASTTWKDAAEKLTKVSQQLAVPIDTTKRSEGLSMTVARWAGDYLVGRNGLLDFNATLANLKKAQEVLDAAFKTA